MQMHNKIRLRGRGLVHGESLQRGCGWCEHPAEAVEPALEHCWSLDPNRMILKGQRTSGVNGKQRESFCLTGWLIRVVPPRLRSL